MMWKNFLAYLLKSNCANIPIYRKSSILACFITATGIQLSTASVGHAQAELEIQCDRNYVVKAGDFLSSIALRAYGNTENYTLIYNANASVIGPDPGRINIGQELKIPCFGLVPTQSSANAAMITNKNVTDPLPGPPSDRPIRVAVMSGWPPYLDEEQEQGGMLTEIINVALANAEGNPSYKIDFINDATAHLNPLIVDHAYDISIGWTRPPCEDREKLQDESLFRCNNLVFSQPMYEEVLGYFNLASQNQINFHDELVGMRICRADGFTLIPLEVVGLREPEIEIVRAPSAPDCINFIIDGKADVALVAVDAATTRISELDVSDQIQLNEAVMYVDVVHAVIAKTHPLSNEIMNSVNDGLSRIKESGEWFAIVRRHLAEFRATTG